MANDILSLQAACDSFCLDFDKNMVEISAALKADTLSPESVRFHPMPEADDEVQGLLQICYYHYTIVIIKCTLCTLNVIKTIYKFILQQNYYLCANLKNYALIVESFFLLNLALSKLHNRTVAMYNMVEKINLHESDELR